MTGGTKLAEPRLTPLENSSAPEQVLLLTKLVDAKPDRTRVYLFYLYTPLS